jgi:hypothetical protein
MRASVMSEICNMYIHIQHTIIDTIVHHILHVYTNDAYIHLSVTKCITIIDTIIHTYTD